MVFFEKLLRFFRLQRAEMNCCIALVVEDKLDGTVAETAVAVVKNHREVHGLKVRFNRDFWWGK